MIHPRRLPGEEGVWVLVLGDMVVFALFFTVYLYDRSAEPAVFNRSQALLNLDLGFINTLLLLTSSLFVVLGVEAVRMEARRRARTMLGLAMLCGVGFFVIKIIEYATKFREGVSIATNPFFMYYFMFTGIHLVHLTIGLAVLGFLYRKAATAAAGDIRDFESGGAFWHMVDLLWIMLFPLLYLVR